MSSGTDRVLTAGEELVSLMSTVFHVIDSSSSWISEHHHRVGSGVDGDRSLEPRESFRFFSQCSSVSEMVNITGSQ